MLSTKKIAVLGVGTLGTSIISGLLKTVSVKSEQIVGTVVHAESIKAAQAKIKQQNKVSVKIGTDNVEAIKDAHIIILAVKPQNMAQLLTEIAPVLRKGQLVISAAAGITLDYLGRYLAPSIPLVRAMPNTCVSVAAGMTGLALGQNTNESHKQLSEEIFSSFGQVIVLEEKHFNALTALSASGPAYLCVVIESLAEAGVKLGMPREIATFLAAQTMLGTGKLILDSKEHPALLKDSVTTPAGCTIDGLMELEEGKLRVTLIKAVVKAAQRAQELLPS